MDLDAMDTRLRKMERTAHADATAKQVEGALDHDELVGRVEALELAVTAMQDEMKAELKALTKAIEALSGAHGGKEHYGAESAPAPAAKARDAVYG